MDIKPVRIQRSRQTKQVSPNGLPIVYCGRPGEFGNPFQVGHLIKIGNGKKAGEFGYLICLDKKWNDGTFRELKTIEQVVEAYKEYLTMYPLTQSQINLLKGKNLSCWCKIGHPCHTDVLLNLVNQ